mmetsp:Transcript_26390/g.36800  ORF Transcript_26390/g.36800 Transcript_26390/m.36800 type:complete len:91 (+) Transcript_26390:82-354(+)
MCTRRHNDPVVKLIATHIKRECCAVMVGQKPLLLALCQIPQNAELATIIENFAGLWKEVLSFPLRGEYKDLSLPPQPRYCQNDPIFFLVS